MPAAGFAIHMPVVRAHWHLKMSSAADPDGAS
jgi:hypothetical protein